MACDACGEQLDGIVALADGIQAAFRAGEVGIMCSDAFIRKLAGRGVRLRECRLPGTGSVNCTVAPDEELLVSRLAVPLAGVQRLDAVGEASVMPGVQHRIEHIPFDPACGEVIYLPRLSQVRPSRSTASGWCCWQSTRPVRASWGHIRSATGRTVPEASVRTR